MDLGPRLEEALGREGSSFDGTLLLAQLTGSRGFNLHVSSSDEDLFGVFAAPIESVICGEPTKSLCGHQPVDYETHELETFLSLLTKGNPKVIEPLFAPEETCWKLKAIEPLMKRARECVLSQNTMKHYLKYARAQKGDDHVETPPKKRYHSLRLVQEAARIARGEPPVVFWREGPDRDQILRFRAGHGTQQEFEDLFASFLAQASLATSQLPEHTDIDSLEPLIVQFRRDYQLGHARQPLSFSGPSALNPVYDAAQRLLGQAGFPSWPILFVGVSGSISSEEDVIGVFATDLDHVLGFHRNRVVQVTPTSIVRAPEFRSSINGKGLILLEVSVFCSLLSAGNHRVLELLLQASERTRWSTPWFNWFLEKRNDFVGKQPVEHCFGMAKSCQKAGNLRLASKFISYCFSLLEDGDLRWDGSVLSEDIVGERIAWLDKNRKDHQGFRNMSAARISIRNHLLHYWGL